VEKNECLPDVLELWVAVVEEFGVWTSSNDPLSLHWAGLVVPALGEEIFKVKEFPSGYPSGVGGAFYTFWIMEAEAGSFADDHLEQGRCEGE